ncbi:hypothetical protein BV22DRAFT_1050691 [Leucogyrophana mollusca]|uniref:Uncharacterized protein n=1 Tax=Leucogyrophana mollusca TaxID=85980 RepID=A0ACB8B3H9_9AGAM|nr:hypothetical protein BV22DRAFT_1050691 [Leucogyrophana mollusca]
MGGWKELLECPHLMMGKKLKADDFAANIYKDPIGYLVELNLWLNKAITEMIHLANILGDRVWLLDYGIPGMSIQEILNKRQGHSTGNEYIQRIMNGLKPTAGRTRKKNCKDLDHFDIVRMDNDYS